MPTSLVKASTMMLPLSKLPISWLQPPRRPASSTSIRLSRFDGTARILARDVVVDMRAAMPVDAVGHLYTARPPQRPAETVERPCVAGVHRFGHQRSSNRVVWPVRWPYTPVRDGRA